MVTVVSEALWVVITNEAGGDGIIPHLVLVRVDDDAGNYSDGVVLE